MLRIHVLPLTFKKQLSELLPYVSRAQQEKVMRFVPIENAHMTLWGELLAKSLLAPMLAGNELCLERNAYGKPRVSGRDDIHFNISHSGSLVVCAIDLHPVGVDVEEILPIDDKMIATSHFSPDEYAFICSIPAAERLSCFYKIWTMKESYVKAIGQGLSVQLRSFSVLEQELNGYRFSSYYQHPYWISVCSLNELLSESWVPETEETVLNRLWSTNSFSGGMLNV